MAALRACSILGLYVLPAALAKFLSVLSSTSVASHGGKQNQRTHATAPEIDAEAARWARLVSPGHWPAPITLLRASRHGDRLGLASP